MTGTVVSGLPIPYETIVSALMNFPSASRNLDGLNSSGSGKTRGSLPSRKTALIADLIFSDSGVVFSL